LDAVVEARILVDFSLETTIRAAFSIVIPFAVCMGGLSPDRFVSSALDIYWKDISEFLVMLFAITKILSKTSICFSETI
jgi:hypothetical protein